MARVSGMLLGAKKQGIQNTNRTQRVDPNRIFWQRNEAATEGRNIVEERPNTANRPPSYISDNGIDYVVEAAPRSIAPTTNVPLPLHPSERGRALPML